MNKMVLGGAYKVAGFVTIGIGIYLIGKGQMLQQAVKMATERPDIILDAVFEVVEEVID